MIRTESGDWRVEVDKDDVVLSPLIPDLPDVTEVVLSGSVAEVVEKQWVNYLDLVKYMDYLESNGSLQPQEMTNLYKCNTVVRDGDRFYPRLVFLHEVNHLSRLINLPKGWEICVGVTEETPIKERHHHLLAMGRVMRESGLADLNDINYNHSPRLIRPFYSIPHRINRDANQEEKQYILDAYWGLGRNMLIRTWGLKDSHPCLDWTQMLWDDLLPLLEGRQILHNTHVVNACALLAGHGDYTKKSIAFQVLAPSRCDHSGKFRFATPITNASELYKRLLAAYPEDVHPQHFGLYHVISEASTVCYELKPGNIGLPTLPAHIHQICVLSWRYSINDVEAMEKLSNIGARGMRRVALCLRHYLAHAANPRAEYFADLVDKYLSEHAELSEEFISLPSVS